MGDSKRCGAACRWTLLGVLLIGPAVTAFSGCQSYVGGQTLPSGYYQQDDVQYHPPGLEFRHPNEAAFMSQAKAAAMNR